MIENLPSLGGLRRPPSPAILLVTGTDLQFERLSLQRLQGWD